MEKYVVISVTIVSAIAFWNPGPTAGFCAMTLSPEPLLYYCGICIFQTVWSFPETRILFWSTKHTGIESGVTGSRVQRPGPPTFSWTTFPGFPDNITSNRKGTFWLALFTVRNDIMDDIHPNPLLKKIVSRLPKFMWPKPKPYGIVLALNESGEIIRRPAGPHRRAPQGDHRRAGA